MENASASEVSAETGLQKSPDISAHEPVSWLDTGGQERVVFGLRAFAGAGWIILTNAEQPDVQAQARLLLNIFRAVRVDLSGDFQVSDLVWPVFSGRQIERHQQMLLAEIVDEWLARIRPQSDPRGILSFGVPDVLKARLARLDSLSAPVMIEFPCSLTQILSDPQGKAAVWSLLGPLLSDPIVDAG
jgi:hypothetical protein